MRSIILHRLRFFLLFLAAFFALQTMAPTVLYIHGGNSNGMLIAEHEDGHTEAEEDLELGEDAEGVGECEGAKINLLALSLVCPLLLVLFDGITFIYTVVIENLLVVSPLDENNTETGGAALYSIWNNFRVIASIMFIGIFMISIIGQVLGNFFTAYEVKRMLPRMLIGIIAVQLSWYIVGFTIDIFNVLGAGISSLILAPVDGLDASFFFDFAQKDNGNDSFFDLNGLGGLLEGFLLNGIVAGVAAGAFLSGGGLVAGFLPIVFGIFFALFLAFLTLLLRRILIMLLIVISPVALVLWILPGTDKFAKQWWGFFWKALLMYPLIVGFIATGRLLAVINGLEADIDDQNAGLGVESLSRFMVSLIALFGPYFAIPLTFQFAGGVLSNLTGNGSRWGKQLQGRVFGSKRDEGSFIGQAAKRKERRKTTRLMRAANKGEGMQDKGRSKYNARRVIGRGISWDARRRVGDNLALLEAEKYKEANDDLRNLVGNGDDSLIQGFTGSDVHSWSMKGLLPPEAYESIRGKQGKLGRDKYGTAAGIEYAVGKMNTPEGIEELRKDFLQDYDKDKWAGIGAGLSDSERAAAWDKAMNSESVQNTNLSEKYKDPKSGTITGGDRVRFATDMSGNKAVGSTFNQKANTYNDLNTIAQETMAEKSTAEGMARQGGGEWQDYLNQVSTQRLPNGQVAGTSVAPKMSSEAAKLDWQARSNALKRSQYQLAHAQSKGNNPASTGAIEARDNFIQTMEGGNL